MARRDLNKIYLNPKPPFGLPDAAPSIFQILFVLSKKIGGVDTYPSSASKKRHQGKSVVGHLASTNLMHLM